MYASSTTGRIKTCFVGPRTLTAITVLIKTIQNPINSERTKTLRIKT